MVTRLFLAVALLSLPASAQIRRIKGFTTATIPADCVSGELTYDYSADLLKECVASAFATVVLPVSGGGTGSAPAADDQVLVSSSSSAAAWKTVPDCDTAATSKLLYDQATNAWSCGTDQTGGLSGLTTNHVAYATSATAITTESGNEFYWDPTNNRLGILDGSPTASLTVGSGDLFTVSSAGAVSTASTITSTYSTGGNALVIDTSTLVADATNNRVGVGDASPDAVFDVEAGSLGNDIKAVTVTATAGSTPTTHHAVNDFQITGAGSPGWGLYALNSELLAGYTGTSVSVGGRFVDWSANSGTDWAANFSVGLIGQSRGTGSGLRFGGDFSALTTTGKSIGSRFRGIGSTGTHGVGLISFGYGGSTANVGVWASLASNVEPTWASTALAADNAAVAAPIFLGYDNGTEKFRIDDGGNVGIGDASPDTSLDILSGSATAAAIMLANSSTGDAQVQFSDADGSADWTICQDQTGGDSADELSIGTTACGTGREAVIDANGVRAVAPTAETISAGGTITANACGGLKLITSTAPRTTDTTNTFTAPAAGNANCCMDVVNTGANAITLDNNANFYSAGAADVVLGTGDSVRVCSSGASGAWYQIGATGNN